MEESKSLIISTGSLRKEHAQKVFLIQSLKSDVFVLTEIINFKSGRNVTVQNLLKP